MSAFLTEAHGQVVNFPSSPGVGDALTEVVTDPVSPGSAQSRSASR